MSEIRSILSEKNQPVEYVSADATAHEAVAQMCRKHIGALVVKENDQPVGIVSERDIMQRLVLQHRDPRTTSVREIMTSDVLCIDPDHDHQEIMALMTERRVRHLPVMDHHQIVGMISIGDLVRFASRRQDFEIRAMREYVSGGVHPA